MASHIKPFIRKNIPHDIRMAMPWYKPLRNIIDTVPDYYIHETDDWLVFPHEMDGLSEEEIFKNKWMLIILPFLFFLIKGLIWLAIFYGLWDVIKSAF